jgi:cobalt-zinc-cadmium efflux system protein
LLHVIGDLIGSVAAITAGAVIYYTRWQPIDALLSLVIALLILGSTVRLMLEALHVLMEGRAGGLAHRGGWQRHQSAGRCPGGHDLHVWNISSGRVALSAHVDLDNLDNWSALLESARQMLQIRFGIAHVTLQPEPAGGINPGYRARVRILPQQGDQGGGGHGAGHRHDHDH